MGVVWKTAAGPTTISLDIDLGSAQEVDAALLFGCTGATAAWTLRVRGADDAGFTTNVYVSAVVPFLAGSEMPTHGRGVGWWTKDDGAISRRYWRFTIAGVLASEQVTVGRVAIGKRNILERNFAFGGGWGIRDLGRVEWSPYGVMLRRRAARLRALGITFPNVRKDEVEQKVQPLIEMNAGQEPIVLVTDPAPDPQRQKRSWFGPIVGELGTVWRAATGWEWRVNLVDLVPIPKAG
jgi:hypothetical protein